MTVAEDFSPPHYYFMGT